MTRLVRFAPLLGLVCLFFTIPAHADTMYTVTGTVTLVGNNACGSSPCTQTIDFSFDFSYQFNQTAGTYDAYLSNLQTNWSGPLGNFTQDFTGQTTQMAQQYWPFADPAGDGIAIYLPSSAPTVLTPTAPTITGADLYVCGSSTCVTDFVPPDQQSTTLPLTGLFVPASVQYTVRTPEPATLSLLAAGMLALGLVGAFSRKVRPE